MGASCHCHEYHTNFYVVVHCTHFAHTNSHALVAASSTLIVDIVQSTGLSYRPALARQYIKDVAQLSPALGLWGCESLDHPTTLSLFLVFEVVGGGGGVPHSPNAIHAPALLRTIAQTVEPLGLHLALVCVNISDCLTMSRCTSDCCGLVFNCTQTPGWALQHKRL
jgi:hypothetical protein